MCLGEIVSGHKRSRYRFPCFQQRSQLDACVQSAVCISSKSSDSEDEHGHVSKATVICWPNERRIQPASAWYLIDCIHMLWFCLQGRNGGSNIEPRRQIEAEPQDLERSGSSLSEFRAGVQADQNYYQWALDLYEVSPGSLALFEWASIAWILTTLFSLVYVCSVWL